jgi:molecular chaperone GrpE
MAANNNGPNNGRNNEITGLDPEHQLPAGTSAEGPAQAPVQRTMDEHPGETSSADKFQVEREALLDQAARLQAELQNSRKRAARDRQEVGELALADALKSLLPVIDSLDRAIPAPVQTVEEFRRGIELIRRQLEEALRRLGVSPISATGEAFDPRLHEAVDVVETGSTGDNQVIEELLPGYRLRDRLLRPAIVRVARNPKEDSQIKAA